MVKKNEQIFTRVLNEKGRIQRDELVTAFSLCGLCSDGGILYDYDHQHGCWSALGNETNRKLREMLPSYLQAKISSALLDGVVNDLIEHPSCYINFRGKMQPYKLNMQNTALDLLTGEKIGRSQEDYFDYYVDADCLDLKQVTLADAPHFLSFLRTSLASDKVAERAKLLLQILGFAISSISGVKKMVFLVGPSDSGKSLFLRFVENVVGRRYRPLLALQDMNQRFRAVELANARVNLCYEAQNSKVKSLDIIKKIVANESFLVERKGKDAFPITPIVKLLTAANCLPPLGEGDNGAVISRILLVLFPNRISNQEMDHDLLEKLLAEKDVILTLAIRELRALIRNNFAFVVPVPEKAYLETYAQIENSIKAFVEEECFTAGNARIHYKDLLDAYKKFCNNNNFRSLSDMDVKQFFLSLPNVNPKKFRMNGQNLWGVDGIGLRSSTFTRIPESIPHGGT